MKLLTTEQKFKDLLNRLVVAGHDRAIAEIAFLQKSCGLDNNNSLVENQVMQKITAALKEIIWMARRYADGRQTFSAINFNDAYDILRDIFGEDIEYNNAPFIDKVLTENGKYYPYAQDGGDITRFDAVKGRKYSNFINTRKIEDGI